MRLRRKRSRRHLEQRLVTWTLRLTAVISILTTVGILVSLLRDTIAFFVEVPIWDFLFGTEWTALFVPQKFGVLPLVAGTFMVALIAGVIALILGMGAAIFLSEYAPDRVRRVIKPVLEVLARWRDRGDIGTIGMKVELGIGGKAAPAGRAIVGADITHLGDILGRLALRAWHADVQPDAPGKNAKLGLAQLVAR